MVVILYDGLTILDHLDHRLFHFVNWINQVLTKLIINYNFIIIQIILLFTMWFGLNKLDLGFYLYWEHY